MDPRNLRRRAFIYGKEPNIIEYHLGPTPVAIDGDTLEEQGGVETEWEDVTAPPRKTKRAVIEKKMRGKKGKKLGKKKPITVTETPQEEFTAAKELVQAPPSRYLPRH